MTKRIIILVLIIISFLTIIWAIKGIEIVENARVYIGKKYNELILINRKNVALDCSGLLSVASGYDNHYYTVSRLNDNKYSQEVRWNNLNPGDILLNNKHVMIFTGWINGNGTKDSHRVGVIQASSSRKEIVEWPNSLHSGLSLKWLVNNQFQPRRLSIVKDTLAQKTTNECYIEGEYCVAGGIYSVQYSIEISSINFASLEFDKYGNILWEKNDAYSFDGNAKFTFMQPVVKKDFGEDFSYYIELKATHTETKASISISSPKNKPVRDTVNFDFGDVGKPDAYAEISFHPYPDVDVYQKLIFGQMTLMDGWEAWDEVYFLHICSEFECMLDKKSNSLILKFAWNFKGDSSHSVNTRGQLYLGKR